MVAALASYMAETAATCSLLYTLSRLSIRLLQLKSVFVGLGDGVAQAQSHRQARAAIPGDRAGASQERVCACLQSALVPCLVEAIAALPRAVRPVMCLHFTASCKMWIFAAHLRLPASLCELISSVDERWLGPGLDSLRCNQAINSTDTHVTRPDTPSSPFPDFRRTEPSCKSSYTSLYRG